MYEATLSNFVKKHINDTSKPVALVNGWASLSP